MTILSLSLVRALALAFARDAAFANDNFTVRDIPDDNRTVEHKQAIFARAKNDTTGSAYTIMTRIADNHGITDYETLAPVFVRYCEAAMQHNARICEELRRKRDARLERERELEEERALIAEMLAA